MEARLPASGRGKERIKVETRCIALPSQPTNFSGRQELARRQPLAQVTSDSRGVDVPGVWDDKRQDALTDLVLGIPGG
jgi:hypothetical protein